MIKLVHPSIQNLSLELVGNREAGKTTAAILVGSIFGGDVDSDIGIGRSASMTKNAFKPMQRGTNDSLLFLDETNLIDKNVAQDLGIFFENTSRDEKARHGSSQRKLAVRNTLLMTGNVPLENSASVPIEKIEAARSRNISVRPKGSIFQQTPKGFESDGAAFGAMLSLGKAEFGTPIREFIRCIIVENQRDSEAISDQIAQKMAKFDRAVPQQDREYDRLLRACSLVYAAGALAIEWNILPIKKKDLKKYCLSVLASQNSRTDANVERLIELIAQNEEHIESCLRDSKKAKRRHVGKNALGFRVQYPDENVHFYFIQGALIRCLGPDATTVLKALRDQNILIGEKGKYKKLSSHAPSHLGYDKRVYKIVLTTNQLEGI